jgi:hypothetical protein
VVIEKAMGLEWAYPSFLRQNNFSFLVTKEELDKAWQEELENNLSLLIEKRPLWTGRRMIINYIRTKSEIQNSMSDEFDEKLIDLIEELIIKYKNNSSYEALINEPNIPQMIKEKIQKRKEEWDIKQIQYKELMQKNKKVKDNMDQDDYSLVEGDYIIESNNTNWYKKSQYLNSKIMNSILSLNK